MEQRKLSNRRARAFGTSIFLVGLAVLSFTDQWWPNIMLVIGLSLCIKQFLQKRLYDGILSIIIFGGVFVIYEFQFSLKILLPILFLSAALFLLVREFSQRNTESEEEEDINIEIEEEKNK